jgi:hypothetical protein
MPAPAKCAWPEAARIAELRADRMSWDRIAALFGVSRNCLMDHAHRLGVHGAPKPPPPARPAPERREPLPPGDPLSWGLLLALTPSISGAAFR